MKKLNFIFSFLLLLNVMNYAQEQELKKINFLPMWVPQPQFAGYYMAREKGIYEKYGLDVNIMKGGYTHDVSTMLNEGEIDFGTLHLSAAVKMRASGIKLVNIAQIFQKSAIEFVARSGSGIDSLADFNGKKIAVWRTIFTGMTYGFLQKHGIEAEIYPMNEGVNLFLKGAVDICVVMHYNEYNKLINYGVNPDELRVFNFNDYGMAFPEDGIYCMEETYTHDPDLCNTFATASMEGWEYALNNLDETLEVMRKIQQQANIAINYAHSQWMLRTMPDMIYPDGDETTMGYLKESDFNNMLELLLQNEEVSRKVIYEDFYRGTK